MRSIFVVGIVLVTFLFGRVSAKEPILFCPIEKSASVFIGTKLWKGLSRPLMTFTNKDGRPAGYIIPAAFERFVKAKGFAREHLFPTPENIALIKKHNVKLIFHVRDLRQRVVSFAHYHMDYVKRKVQKTIDVYHAHGLDVENWTLEDHIEHQIKGVPGVVKRIQGWLDVYHRGEIPMLITTFEEFVDNETLDFFRNSSCHL